MRKDILLQPLPELLVSENGSEITTVDAWEKRKQQIAKPAVDLEFGGMPPKPEAMELEVLTERGPGLANCYRAHCMIGTRDFVFCFTVHRAPGDGEKPAIITGDAMYNRNCDNAVIAEANSRGISVVIFNRTEFAPDRNDSERRWGIYSLYPDLRFSAISAWAWGYHRVVDALEMLDYIDMEHLAASGHSRGGKTVLLAGATDERIRYVNPNGSGAHGCGCYRFIQQEEDGQYEDTRSEELKDLFAAVPYWMGEGMREYIGRETELPHDMHFFKALIAPRILLETNAYGDIWANPRGSYLTHLAAKKVWKLYGEERNCLTWYREGVHDHGMPEFLVLMNVMEADINKLPVPEECMRIPYPEC